jgi:hypothetical protein
MAGKVGVMIIHGMGDTPKDFADKLIVKLSKRLGKQADHVEFVPCYWSPILQKYQDKTWERLLQGTRMDARPVRKFIVGALGDAAGYLAGYFKDRHPTAYDEIHERVRASLAKLESRLGSETPAPLMVLAHSLGSIIMSNYIWDEQAGQGVGKTPFEKTDTLTGFITYGSNIPLFLPPRNTIECIRFPSKNLPKAYKKAAQWINIYDPDDVLGYPLNTIWTKRNRTVIKDVTVDAGPLILSGTPLSHIFYNADGDFQKIVVEQINAVLNVS